jgi:glycosyltransferase involved in cell wall biosynthesis
MKILLISNYLNDAQESMLRFAALMEKGLTQCGHEVRILRPESKIGRLRSSGIGLGKWLGYIDKFGVFPHTLKSALSWADVVHICDHSNSFYINYLKSVPHIVSCHDLIAVRSALGEVPQHVTRWTGRQLQRMIVKGLCHAQHIVCDSEATKRQLLRITRMPEERVSRTYLCLNYPYSRMERDEAMGRLRELQIEPGQVFFLHVGGNDWYKNRIGVLRMFSVIRKLIPHQKPKMVMVGKPWTEQMRRFVTDNGMIGVTSELSGIGNEDLRALYSTATMLLFPSLDEGFGWPIVEAQACGCPVLTSGRPPMDEVGGAAALYVDPEDTNGAAHAAVAALSNGGNGLRDASIRNASRFDITTMIEGYLSVYEKVASSRFCLN